jgi:hypothetical protein
MKKLFPLAAIAVLAIVGVTRAADETKGTFTKYDADKGVLTITDKDGKDTAFTLSKDVKITCDDKECKMDDIATADKGGKLKGATITVTGTKDAPKTVVIATKKADKPADKK